MATDTTTTEHPGDVVGVAATLVFVQAAILVTGVVETWVFSSFLGPGAIGAMAMNGAGAILALGCAWGLGRGRRWAHRATLIGQGFVVSVAVLDVILAPLLLGAGIGLVAVLTRLVVPVVVIAILRRPAARARFVRTTLASEAAA